MAVRTEEKRERYQMSGWDLSALVPPEPDANGSGSLTPSAADTEELLAELEQNVTAFEGLREEISAQMGQAKLIDALQQYEEISAQVYRLLAYGSLWFSSNTQSPDALTYNNRMQQVMAEIQNRTLFFNLWWKGLDDADAEALLPDADTHEDYRHFLLEMRLSKPYMLEESSERIINLKNTNGVNALVTIYSMLTNRLEFELEVDGELKQMTREEVMAHAYSADPDMRAAAYQCLYKVYKEEAPILAQIYINLVRDYHNENVTLRSYSSPIAVRNLSNDIPYDAVQALLDVARRNAPLFQRYFTLKAKWLGMDKLRRYDIYAPLMESSRDIPYDDAVELVLDTFTRFDLDFAGKAKRVFDDNHVDSEVRKGKRAGAFCATVMPSITPYVLLNYTNKVRDVATIAHELGHAVHSMMAEDHSILTQHSSLPLAETASVFAEMVMNEQLLAEEKDPLVRREILAASVDDIYATVMRQAFFVIFEEDAHRAIQENASPQELERLYFENLQEQFGDSVELSDEFQYEWVSIPHIYHTPFYCYAYSFGQLLVLSLFRRYQQEGDAFKPGYLRMLARGGSARPQEILEEAGIDMTDPDFWQAGFDVIRDMIDELEAMTVS
ncbi:MAG: M3 family oligoendopeptidase [Caldilineaceae bacterium SB0670_bin_27]|uniref:M3 family oligoendopeptidase n=1 Tax=Caldilineaceae bacterium SB0664_bin_27 TaxID=2605260 RepID=A0A6B0Z1G3_9CHLR|nr:M3 family oligoendopeptidase [Caldilineaceae bacterium SB0664_bin_27]MYJ78960.1 M3 family oligoendopeptidase [Caldilineaceae bacterium SB0670_bin_27]